MKLMDVQVGDVFTGHHLSTPELYMKVDNEVDEGILILNLATGVASSMDDFIQGSETFVYMLDSSITYEYQTE